MLAEAGRQHSEFRRRRKERSLSSTRRRTRHRNDRKDQIFVGTSPDGKVYKVSAAGKSEVFTIPRLNTSGRWPSQQGDLLVGTGDEGEIIV